MTVIDVAGPQESDLVEGSSGIGAHAHRALTPARGETGRDHPDRARLPVPEERDLDAFPSNGVFTGPHPTRDAVVRTGTVIGGKVVQSVSGCREMLNPLGQVAATVTYSR